MPSKNYGSSRMTAIVNTTVAPVIALVVIAALFISAIIGTLDSSHKATNYVDSYSWAELSGISAEISAADSKEAAIEVATNYHLCSPNGKLDGTQVKNIELANGVKVQVQIIGFAHDDKANGTGKAGITFMFTSGILQRPMNASATSEGGWRESQMRSWLASDCLNMFPEDLKGLIVRVNKSTNNGRGGDANSISVTDDRLWLLSVVELGGNISHSDWIYGDEWVVDAYNMEGSQYKLFQDVGVKYFSSNPVLARQYMSKSCVWWQRTPCPNIPTEFRATNAEGDFISRTQSNAPCAVIPAFAI